MSECRLTTEQVEALLERDSTDSEGWPEVLLQVVRKREQRTPIAALDSRDISEHRQMIFEEAVLRRCRFVDAYVDVLIDALHDRVPRGSLEHRLLMRLSDGINEYVAGLLSATWDIRPKLDEVFPQRSTAEVLAALGEPRKFGVTRGDA